MKKLKKNYTVLIAIVAIILVSSIGLYFLNKSMKSEKSTKIVTYTIPESEKIFVNGIITPEQSKDLYLDATKGKVNSTSVKDGQVIKKGDTLFTYKNDQITEQITQLKYQLKTSEAQRKELLAQKDAQEKAQKEAIKNQALLAANGGQQSASTISPSNGSTISTTAIDNQISSYRDQLKSLKGKEYVTITAPIDGKVTLHEETSNMTSPYITLNSVNFNIKGTVNEKDKPKIKENQVAEILVLSTNTNIKGKVLTIGDRPVSAQAVALPTSTGASSGNSSMSSYDVLLSLDSQDNLTDGFHIQATIKLEDKGVEIPKSAAVKSGDKSYVFKVVNKKLVKVEVAYTEEGDNLKISSGLSQNDEIVEKPNDGMKEGMSVE